MRSGSVWSLARRQHGVVTHAQLSDLGYRPDAIHHRLDRGRLHTVHRGVYALGRPELGRLGELMAAVLAAGDDALLSHESGAELLGAGPRCDPIHVTVMPARSPRVPGIVVHRRQVAARERGFCDGIPVTSPARTLCDLATRISADALERSVNEADKHGVIDPEALRMELERMGGRPGVRALRALLDRDTFTLTDSGLERLFRPIARAAGLPPPQTQQRVNGFRVDFFWLELGLVVETDGLRYHRTAAQQARALTRDHEHFRRGLLPLRFSHSQIALQPDQVREALEEGLRRCLARAA